MKAERAVAGCYLRLGLARISFGFPRVLKGVVVRRHTRNCGKVRTIVCARNFASSWSPHNAQQRVSEMNRKEKIK